jgi:hypothetical protein
MSQFRHRTYLLTGTLLTGMLVAFFLAVLSGGAKARAEVGDPVLVAAGDIADCNSTNDEDTANLLGTMPADAKVATLGDGAYPNGSASDYQNCYDPSWGTYKYFDNGSPRTLPATGNHDYKTAGASGYFGYFGAAAGDPTKGYYSYNLGSSWHIVVLNSNCTKVGGCTATSLGPDRLAPRGLLECPVQEGSRGGAKRPSTQLRALRPPEPERGAGHGEGHKGVRGRNGRRVLVSLQHHHNGQQRGAPGEHLWCAEANPAR